MLFNLMFMKKTPFLITVGHRVKFIAAGNLTGRLARTLLNGLDNVNNLYLKQDVKLDHLYMDNQFEVLRSQLDRLEITLNTTAAKEHVPTVGHQIRVVK